MPRPDAETLLDYDSGPASRAVDRTADPSLQRLCGTAFRKTAAEISLDRNDQRDFTA